MGNTKNSTQGLTLSKVSTFTFIGMTCALVASVRNIPDVAATGWTMFFYMIVGALLFGLPIALISGEYAGMYPSAAGGPELWTTKARGKKWGFVTSWLLWVQMFPGMVMVASVLAPMLCVGINQPALGENNIFTLVMILGVYWAVTLLNLKFDMAKIGGKWGIWFMLYIPIIIIFLLGAAALFKTGIDPHNLLGHFEASSLVPWGNKGAIESLQYFGPIIFIFTGIEMSSVYIKRLEKPVKQYISGVFAALAIMFIANTFSALIVANVVNTGNIDLNNVAQPVVFFCQILGLPTWIGNIFGLFVFVGVMVQLSAWITGPSKTITQAARRGLYPPKFEFWKNNKMDVAPTVLLTQATIISIFALVFLLIPGVNSAFLTLVNATTIIYCFVYIIMAVGIIRLRKTQPDLARPFRIGKKGDGLLKAIAIILMAIIVISCFYSVYFSSLVSAILTVVVAFAFLIIPLFIFKKSNPSWASKVQELMKDEPHNIPEESEVDIKNGTAATVGPTTPSK
ncbi:Amino acid transporter [Eubacterium aggregans]|uniref:Amino acid transporter n=1 Tax=Eubacterium aggregans TaxID=81409 RepID=A0A1H4C6P9_9FIRM|nr:amino acid permease [Eubacterium aggregans]SEA56125.1 Amino acid transporter [Eubacterium aggregans]